VRDRGGRRAQQLGGAIGIAVIGTLFFSVAGHHGITTALEKMLYVEAGNFGPYPRVPSMGFSN